MGLRCWLDRRGFARIAVSNRLLRASEYDRRGAQKSPRPLGRRLSHIRQASAYRLTCRLVPVPGVPTRAPLPSERSEEHTSELQSHRDLHSFPTRRSSDLLGPEAFAHTAGFSLPADLQAGSGTRGADASTAAVGDQLDPQFILSKITHEPASIELLVQGKPTPFARTTNVARTPA